MQYYYDNYSPSYRYMEPNRMPMDIYTYPQNLPMALKLITEALSGETEDKLFYNYLLSVAPSQEDKDIICGIRNDEMKHFKLFRQIYFELTCQMPPQPRQEEFKKPSSYCQGIKRAILGELAAVEKYRKILFAMQDRRHINMLTEIITDELRHASLYNLLYSKNECYEEEEGEEKED